MADESEEPVQLTHEQWRLVAPLFRIPVEEAEAG